MPVRSARPGERICKSQDAFKAWSQNLGHTGMLVTFSSEGHVPEHLQSESAGKLGKAALDQSGAINAMPATLQTRRRRQG